MFTPASFFFSLLALVVFAASPHTYAAQDCARTYFDLGPAKAGPVCEREMKAGASSRVFLNAAAATEAGDMAKAEAAMRKALAAHGEDYEVKSFAAMILTNAGHYAEAIELLTASATRKTQASDYFTLGRAYAARGDYARAETAYKKALSARPRFAAAAFMLGNLYFATGKPEAAEEAYRNTLKADSQFLEARKMLAETLERRKNYDEAWKQYTRAALAEPSNTVLKNKTGAMLPFLTKKPEELLPPVVFSGHRLISVAAGAEGLPALRIGIGSTIGGAPIARKAFEFTVSSAFRLTLKEGGTAVATGRAGELWSVNFSSAEEKNRLIIKNASGTVAGFAEKLFLEPESSSSTIILRALLSAQGTAWTAVSDKELRGGLEFRLTADRGGIQAVNIVNIEEYVYGVLASEMPASYPKEALKAQAVLARTYAMYNVGRHREYGYDLCDGQHCQVYAGVTSEDSRARAAIDATRGEILSYGGKPVSAVFYSNCGGFSQAGENTGWGSNPYWCSVSDYTEPVSAPDPYLFQTLYRALPKAYCGPDQVETTSQFRWSRVVYAADIAAEVATVKNIGELHSIRIDRRAKSGHVGQITLIGSKGELAVSKEYQIRQLLGLGLLRSVAFVPEPFYLNGKLEYVTLYGAGWGHGVGFCQTGAAGRAKAGSGYRDILQHYYPGTRLSNLKK